MGGGWYEVITETSTGCATDEDCEAGLECAGTGDERKCQDYNECTDPRFTPDSSAYCGDFTYCENTVGGYTCHCITGYDYWAANSGCSEVDECTDPNYTATSS